MEHVVKQKQFPVLDLDFVKQKKVSERRKAQRDRCRKACFDHSHTRKGVEKMSLLFIIIITIIAYPN